MLAVNKGDVYGSWTVISDEFLIKNGKKYVFVRCKCGLEKYVYFYYLRTAKSAMCKKCSSQNAFANNKAFQNYVGKGKYIGDLGATLFNNYRLKVLVRDLEFEITQQYLWDLLVKQNFKCNLTGLDIHLSKKCHNGNPKWDEITASPDRIDNTKGYIKGNIQWVHKQVNLLKNRFDNNWFIQICKLVASKYDNSEPSPDLNVQERCND